MAKDMSGLEETRKPETGRFKQTAARLRQGKDGHLKNRACLDFRLDQRTVCDRDAKQADVVAIDGLVETIRLSRTGAALLDALDNAGVKIVYDAQIPVSQYYPRSGGGLITLNPHRPRGDLFNALCREIRRAWQHHHDALVNPLSFEPEEAVLVNRAQQADVMMIAVKIAWELRLVGQPEAWDYLTFSPMADVSRTFELRAQNDFRTLNNGEASRAAYDKFFENSRTKMHDKRIIHQMLLDESGYIRSRNQRERVSMSLFQKLGEMPHSRNYLSMHADRAPTDHAYATVEDRSNANFLWFIKFERNFQEKEAAMAQEAAIARQSMGKVVEFIRGK